VTRLNLPAHSVATIKVRMNQLQPGDDIVVDSRLKRIDTASRDGLEMVRVPIITRTLGNMLHSATFWRFRNTESCGVTNSEKCDGSSLAYAMYS
jgi:hypothetical protein